MKLLLDEDTQGKAFVALLRAAGHDAETVTEVGLTSQPDQAVLAYAIASGRVLLTRNTGDFLALHAADPAHPGILAEYQDDDPSKNMTYAQIVAAVGNIEASGWQVAGEFVVLNAWR